MFDVIGIYTWYFVGIPSEYVHVAYEEVYEFGSVVWTEFSTDFKILFRIRRENHRIYFFTG